MTFARWTYRVAGLYGLLVIVPMFFTLGWYEADHPPAVTHPEFYYGFAGVTLAWQLAFMVIGQDPRRYRPLMPVTWVEKFAWTIAASVLFAMGKLNATMFIAGLVDGALGVGFVVAFFRTRRI